MVWLRVFIAVLLAQVLCAQASAAYPTYLLNRSFGSRYYQLDSIFRKLEVLDTATAGKIIRDLIKWADEEDDEELKYSLEIVGFRSRLYKPMSSRAQFEGEMAALIAKLHKMKLSSLEAEALSVYAEYCWGNSMKYAAAFEYGLDAYNIYARMGPEDFPRKQEYTAGLAGGYFRFGDYRTSSRYLLEALRLPKARVGPHLHSMLNTLALCYRNLGVYDSAEIYFRQAYASVPDTVSDIWAGIISGNLGITYYKEKKYSAAIPFLEKDIKMSLGRDDGNAANSIAVLGDVYMNLGDKQKGMELAQQAYGIVIAKHAWSEYALLVTIYTMLSRAYALTGDYRLAYIYSDSSKIAKDSATKVLNGITLAAAQHNYELEKHKRETEIMRREESVNGFLRNTLLVAIAAAWLIAFLIINRQRLSARLKQEQLETAKTKAEMDLQNSQAILHEFTNNIFEKNELIERFNEELEQLRRLPDAEKIARTQDSMMPLMQSAILSGEQWEQFKALFEKANPGYLERLRSRAPSLSPVEIRFVVLSKLQMDSKGIASMLGISLESAQQNKQKLKAKLNLPEDMSLDKFANSI